MHQCGKPPGLACLVFYRVKLHLLALRGPPVFGAHPVAITAFLQRERQAIKTTIQRTAGNLLRCQRNFLAAKQYRLLVLRAQ